MNLSRCLANPARVLVALVLSTALASTGCTKPAWKCSACVRGQPGSCAESNANVDNRSEDEAQCSAGEQLCWTLDAPTFDRICRGQQFTRMIGCSDAFLSRLTFTCSEESKLFLPLPGVR